MVSKRKREEGLRRFNVGRDAEDWERVKKAMNPMNKVKNHSRPNSPYDFEVVKRDPIQTAKRFVNNL